MERISTITFRGANLVGDFLLISLAYAMGCVFWWYYYFNAFSFAILRDLDIQAVLVPYLIFYGTIFYYLACSGVYHLSRLQTMESVTAVYLRAACIGLVLLTISSHFLPFVYVGRTLIVVASVSSFFLLIAKEYVLRGLLQLMQSRGYYVHKTLIVGTDPKLIDELYKESKGNYLVGMDIIGVVTTEIDGREPSKSVDTSLPILGSIKNLVAILEKYNPASVIFFAGELSAEVLKEALWICEERGLEVWIKLDILERVIYQASLYSLGDLSFITLRGGPQNEFGLVIKYSLDRIVSGILLLFFSPLLLVVAILIKLTSPGPVLFKQERAGWHGKTFEVLKFRSMVVDAEEKKSVLKEQNEMYGPAFKIKDDPRVTRLGKFLRKTSIDELPQLWNVFKGEMSLVGPRPMDVKEVLRTYGWHRRRLIMKPGITCIWQVAGRNEIKEFDDWVRMDLEYIDNWSLWLDFVLLLKTIPVVLFGRGAS